MAVVARVGKDEEVVLVGEEEAELVETFKLNEKPTGSPRDKREILPI